VLLALYAFVLYYLCFFMNLSRFNKGLAVLGVGDALMKSPAAMKDLFTFAGTRLDATTIELLFVLCGWSEKGSNRYREETRAQTHWRDYLQDLEGRPTILCVRNGACILSVPLPPQPHLQLPLPLLPLSLPLPFCLSPSPSNFPSGVDVPSRPAADV
jgi:hypothetical protein